MQELNGSQVKEVEYGLLCKIADVCSREGITFSLVGGTLLGAVRHQGFIPWDDDIDIAMPRVDYERFFALCSRTDLGFVGECAEINPSYGGLSGKVFDPRTEIFDPFAPRGNYKMGVYVDVFPIDGLGDSLSEAQGLFKKTRFVKAVQIASNWGRYNRSLTHGVWREPLRLMLYAASRFLNPNRLSRSLNRRYSARSLEDCAYAGIFSGSYGAREIMPSSVFTNFIDMEFETGAFPVFEKYDEYLSSIYGDYMKLPPVEKRVSRHECKAYWL